MKKMIYKKVFVTIIIIIFLSISLSSSINAELITNTSYNNINYLPIHEKNNTNLLFDLLIITSENYTETLQTLKEHKENIGISTKIATLNEVYENMFWQGRDKAEKIKFFIKKAIDEWSIKYVFIRR